MVPQKLTQRQIKKLDSLINQCVAVSLNYCEKCRIYFVVTKNGSIEL